MNRSFLCAIFIFLYISSSIYADWNKDFDRQSGFLVEAFPQLQGEYLSQYEELMQIRAYVLHNKTIQDRIKASTENDKFLIPKERESLIVKKRRYQNLNEFFVWELSFLLGASKFFVPSFPVEIGSNKVIVQKMESFTIGNKNTKIPPKHLIKKVSLIDYWTMHLAAYLLGVSDLVGRNIGINSKGIVRLFDTEKSFYYQNSNQRKNRALKICFLSHSLDWPQVTAPLFGETLIAVQEFVQNLPLFIEKLALYKQYRPFVVEEEKMLVRLRRIQSFPLREGQSFYDFYKSLDPILVTNLPQLENTIQLLLKRPVGLGSMLFFLHVRDCKKNKETSAQEKKLNRWIENYEELSYAQ